jgi:hypothetical protein
MWYRLCPYKGLDPLSEEDAESYLVRGTPAVYPEYNYTKWG